MSILQAMLGPIARVSLNAIGRRRLPPIDGTLDLPGLSGPVEVIRDRWGIPHIYASTAHDLFFAQGVVHAQDRLWQMELNRRIASGRLSELFGELTLETDRVTRTFGFRRLGLVDWSQSDPALREVILAYTEGVNAWLNSPQFRRPLELALLNHRMAPWTPEDSMAFGRLMIWKMSHAWYGEIVRARLLEAVGPERAAELEVHYPSSNPPMLPQGIEFNRIDAGGTIQPQRGPWLSRSRGSNGWAIAGIRSATGRPFLCNDVHLELALPSLWYECHLLGAGYNVTGVSLPGLPMIQIGHNEQIAWGATLAFTDCEDLFVEKFDAAHPRRYEYQGEWHDAQVIPEEIAVKGRKKPHREEVVVTRHGPIISDVVGHAEQRLAVQSMALRPCPTFYGWLLLNQARGWDDFVKAVRQIEAPQLSIPYADVEGNIGLWVTGKVPVRAKGSGMIPAPGWTGEYEWIGEVPFEEMPHVFNPAQGYVVTCNNKIVPDDYPHYLGSVWMNGYRARRLSDMIEAKARLETADFQAMHADLLCLPGLELVRRLEGLRVEDADQRIALEKLRSWDGQLTADSVAGAVYEVLRYSLVRNILKGPLGDDLTDRVMGKGFHPLMQTSSEFYGHDTFNILRMLDEPGNWWVGEAGGREAVLKRSLAEAVVWLKGELGADPDGWQWGRFHNVLFAHPMSQQKPLDQVFDRGPYPIGGDTDTVCQTAISTEGTTEAGNYGNKAWSPTYRQIIDMSDFSKSISIHPPGQSGQIGSKHYDDFVEHWLHGRYHPMLWTREEIEREAEGRLELRPRRK